MADMMDTLKGLLGDGAEDKIKTALGALGGEHSAPVMPDAGGLEYIAKLKGFADELSHPNDARSTLLMSLKPYMRGSRQKSIDNAVKLINLSKFTGLFR